MAKITDKKNLKIASMRVALCDWTEEDLRAIEENCKDLDGVSICEYVSRQYGIELTLEEADRLSNAIETLDAALPEGKRVKLALAAYESAIVGAESFEEEHLGADLAYLMAAILKDGQCEWPADRAIVRVLKLRLTKVNREAIFKHIRIEKLFARMPKKPRS